MLEKAQWVVHVGRLHQLARSLGDRDISRSSAPAEGTNDVDGETDHLGRGFGVSSHRICYHVIARASSRTDRRGVSFLS